MGCSKKIFLGLILGFSIGIIGSSSAFAARVSNIGPTPDASSGGTAYYAVGTGSFDGRDSWVKIYVPIGQSTEVRVSQACSLDVGDPNVNYRLSRLNQQETSTTLLQALDGESSTGGCRSSVTFNISDTNGVRSSRTGHENWRAFFLRASINNSLGDNERSFRVVTSNPNSYVSSAKGIGVDVANKPLISITETLAAVNGTIQFLSLLFVGIIFLPTKGYGESTMLTKGYTRTTLMHL